MKMLLGLAYLLLLSGSVLCYENCTYLSLIDHLGLTNPKKKDMFTLSRPVEDWRTPLEVIVALKPETIMDVKEADQTLISFVSIVTRWHNHYIEWEEDCPIERITVPMELLWRPDLGIYEEVEKDKSSQGTFLVIKSGGSVHMKTDQVIVSMCKMDVHKFPFDSQRCHLSIRSFIHTNDEIRLVAEGNGRKMTEKYKDENRIEYEWLFQEIEVTNITRDLLKDDRQDRLVYTITIKRRSVLYVVNFILPVLFFLGLDYATFLMADGGGDKLAFKITILLAVTVLQLLLNDILPSSSDSIPLIAVFCIGVFCLMKFSLLHTILVMYLLERDSKGLSSCTAKTAQEDDWKSTSWFKCCQKKSSDDLLSHHMKDKEVEDKENAGPGLGGSDVDRLLHELRKMCEVLSDAVGDSKEDGYWGSRICVINRVFLVVHGACTALFLAVIFFHWFS